MRCRTARGWMLDRRVGRLAPERAAALDEHLLACDACSAEARAEREIARLLGELRTEAPFEIDVTRRVMESVERLGPVPGEEVPPRQLAWALAAAAAVSLALLVGTVFEAPSMLEPLGRAGTYLLGVSGFLVHLVRPVLDALAAAGRVARVLIEAFVATASLLRGAAPLIRGIVLLSVAIVTAVWMTVIGRDLRGYASTHGRKER